MSDIAAAGIEQNRLARQKPKAIAAADYLPQVDALRAFAVIAVIIFHCELMHFGWAGVWLFFVISGFAITTSLLNSELGRPSAGLLLRNFYIRRALRIWPLYFSYLILAVAICLLIGFQGPLADVPWIATFTHNFRMSLFNEGRTEWLAFNPLWTLAIEEQFYLLYPLLFAVLGLRGLVVALACVIGIAPFVRYFAGVAAANAGLDADGIGKVIYMFPFAQFDAFAAGCLLALLRPKLEGRLGLARAAFFAALAFAAAYAAFYVLEHRISEGGGLFAGLKTLFPHHNYGALREVFVYPVIWMLSAALIWLLIAREPLLRFVCNLPGLQAIGRVSFGAYIYHGLVIWAIVTIVPWFDGGGQAMNKVQRVVLMMIAIPATLALAFPSYHFFEKRFLALRHRFG